VACLFKIKYGFTLVEVLLVIVIVGILAAIVMPRIIYDAAQARKQACRANISAINAEAELWHLQTGNWPQSDLSDIFASIEYFPEGTITCPVRAAGETSHNADYLLDSTTHRVLKGAGTQHP
jgi:prepilin-type N-terminal cleavage/methylation domain-containing protein